MATITKCAGVLVEKKSIISNSIYFPMQFDLRGHATRIYFVHVFDKYTHTEAVGKVFIQR